MRITKSQIRRIVREAARSEINENAPDYPFQPNQDIAADKRVGEAVGNLYTAVMALLANHAGSDVPGIEIARVVSDIVFETMMEGLSKDWDNR